MIVIPAVDLRGGRAVRAPRGNASGETPFAEDPVKVAERFQEEGARRLHIVDLDAGLSQGDNLKGIKAVCHAVAVPVQVGGGVRTLEDVAAVLETGASRAILDTAAAADAAFVSRAVEEFAEHVVVAVDVRGGHIMLPGTLEGAALEEALAALDDAGAPRYLITSVARDGTLEGPDVRLYARVLKLTGTPLIANGGVRDAADVWSLCDLGCEAVVTGKALYEKTLKLSQVIRG